MTDRKKLNLRPGRDTDLTLFYKNTNIFITGATGFLGKVLINKLIREFDLQQIFIMVRQKKGKEIEERVADLFKDPLFDRMNNEVPYYRDKIVPIYGDCIVDNLGLSQEDRKLLISKVNIVFHCAATVRFDESLKVAAKINVQGTKCIMDLCKEMVQLKSVMYMSTIYSNCPNKDIEEVLYPPPMDVEEFLKIVDNTPEEELNKMAANLVGQWPNTYTFTKCLAEHLAYSYAVDLPVGIFRPAIVMSTFRDPIPGWTDNFYGASGVLCGVFVGLLRVIYADGNQNANTVPVDLCVNAFIASAWDTVGNRNKHVGPKKLVSIYNFCMDNNNAVSCNLGEKFSHKYSWKYPAMQALWYPFVYTTTSRFKVVFLRIFLHYLPAVIVDAAAKLAGKKPRLMKTYKRIDSTIDTLSYFMLNYWNFSNRNIRSLWKKLAPDDKENFYFDMENLVWEDFFKYQFRGARKYLLKESEDTFEAARKKMIRLFWIHQITKYSLFSLCFWGLWIIVSRIFF